MKFVISDKINRYNLLGWLIAIIAINNIIAITPNTQTIYYIFIIITLLFLIIESKNQIKISISAIVLLSACVVSILFNEIPSFFSPWFRLMLFIFVGGLIGPFFSSKQLDYFRCSLFIASRWLLLGVTILSALGHILGFSTRMPYFGYYNGITTHCNILGLCAAETVIFCSYLLLCNYHNWEYLQKYIFIFFIVISILMILGAASRSALLSALGGLIVLCCFFANKERKLLINVLYVSIFIMIICFPYWKKTAQIIINKNQGIQLNFETRIDYWKNGWEVFKKSPLIGDGFAGISSSNFDLFGIDTNNGRVETGSSWLAILDMIGMFGTIPFLVLFFNLIRKLIKFYKETPNIVILLSSSLVVSIIHMCSEGYILAAGGIGFFLFWSILGVISSFDNLNIIKSFSRLINNIMIK